MSYSPPSPNSVDFELVSYTPPDNDGVDFEFGSEQQVGINLYLIDKGTNYVEFGWTDTDSWDNYQIERNAVIIDTVPGSQETYMDTGLSSDAEYEYRVRGFRTT